MIESVANVEEEVPNRLSLSAAPPTSTTTPPTTTKYYSTNLQSASTKLSPSQSSLSSPHTFLIKRIFWSTTGALGR